MNDPRILNPTPQPPQALAHFVVRCANYSSTLTWYKTVLTAQVAFSNDFLAFLSYDDEHHRVALINIGTDALAKSTGVGIDHIAFGMTDMSALMSHYSRLKEIDIKPVWCIHHGGTLSLYYEDPEGVRCEFQVEVFGTPAEFTEYMKGPIFKDNPIGVEYDPEVVLQRYLAGESDERLLDQTLLTTS